jgi:hypothetical protein
MMSNSADLFNRIKGILDSRLELEKIQGKHVIVTVKEKLSAADRGALLLDTERRLRKQLDAKFEVFLEPRGDLNKLRLQLRGVGYES